MGYLIQQDYYRQIQQSQLSQLITSNTAVLSSAERAAVAEVRSYLIQRYLIDTELTDTELWSNTKQYSANSRIYLDATAYSSSSTYALGTLALQSGIVYRCSSAITVAEPFNVAHWEVVGNQYQMYYAQYPKPVFDLYGNYKKDDQVYYKGHTYKALLATTQLSQFGALQYGNINSIPANNIYPDDPANGATYWSDLGAYSISAGTLPGDATYWTLGDNRNQQILLYLIDIVLYHLHSRISPQNVPELRQNRYDDAKDWLKRSSKGTDVTLDLPIIQPKQGNPIRYGGDVKQINNY